MKSAPVRQHKDDVHWRLHTANLPMSIQLMGNQKLKSMGWRHQNWCLYYITIPMCHTHHLFLEQNYYTNMIIVFEISMKQMNVINTRKITQHITLSLVCDVTICCLAFVFICTGRELQVNMKCENIHFSFIMHTSTHPHSITSIHLYMRLLQQQWTQFVSRYGWHQRATSRVCTPWTKNTDHLPQTPVSASSFITWENKCFVTGVEVTLAHA